MDAKLLTIDYNTCKKCYACVRVCPVSAIVVQKTDSFPVIHHNRCIGCGSCYTVCSPKSLQYKDGIFDFLKLIEEKQTIAAIVDPSISGEFDDITDYRKFVEMIRALGFHFVYEVSFGVDIVALEYQRLFENFRGKYYISSNCPALVAYVQKYKPELINNLAPIASPMTVTAKIVRQIQSENIKIVFIGPCIAAKADYFKDDLDGKIDVVLTFEELRILFTQFNLVESKVEFSDFDPPYGYKGSLYPISNGILEAANISERLLEGNVITTEGKPNMLQMFQQFERHIDDIKKHFNSFYDEGCIMGPGMKQKGEKYLRKTLVINYAKKRLKNFDIENWNALIEKYSKLDLKRTFINDDQRLPEPMDEKVNEVLKVLGKKSREDHLGCLSCGYESCYDFAVNVAKGLTNTDMCLPYTLRNRQEYINALKVSHEKLATMQSALQESERKARKEEQTAREASERISAMLQKMPSGAVITDNKLRIIESNESFINILGNEAHEINEIIPGLKGADLKTLLPVNIYKLFEYVIENDDNVLNKDVQYGEKMFIVSIFTIKKGKVIGAVLRDMYSPEVRKEEVIKRVGDVIDDNLKMVQKIGFLLGENASKVEKKLNSIIESYKSDKLQNKE